MSEAWKDEASAAWRAAGLERRLPALSERGLLAAAAIVGAATMALLGLRIGLALDAPALLVTGAGLALAFLLGPYAAWRRARRRAEAEIERTRQIRTVHGCPRCRAPLLARDSAEHGERDCGRCAARLLEAEGLVIAYTSDPTIRAARWRARARVRFATRGAQLSLAGVAWLGAVVASIGALFVTGALVGPPGGMRAPLGLVQEIPNPEDARDGTASAHGEAPEAPAGRATRPLAPLHVGTQVLAQRPVGSTHHQLAVIVRVRRGRAFVVYADGSSDWVGRRGVLAPELAEGDGIEVWDGARYQAAVVRERVGPALRVDGLQAEWTSAARVRVRVDGAHARGEGRRYDIPPGAWVDAREAGAWRPGLAVESSDGRLRVALSDGAERWFDEAQIRAQELGPGARVYVDGQPGTWIVAARIGHALAVVDPRGAHGWTSLSRVRRR